MSKHSKHKPIPKPFLIGSLAVSGIVLITVLILLLVNNGVFAAISGVISASKESDSSAPTSLIEEPNSSQPEEIPLSPPQFARPGQMKGTWLTAGEDYALTTKDSGEKVKAQIDAAFAVMADWDFNTVLVPMNAPKNLTIDGAAFDPLAYIAKESKAKGWFAYGVLDMRVSEAKGWNPAVPADAAQIHDMVQAAAAYETFDGFLLDDYAYANKNIGNAEAVSAVVTEAVSTLKKQSRDFYVGLLTSAVWAHASVDARGSKTDGIYEEYTDGHADTLAFLASGSFDFVMVKNDQPMDHATAKFQSILDWWADAVGELPLYIAHATNFPQPNQLSRQYLACKACPKWQGSAFRSLAALKKNAGGSTTVLLKAMEGSLDVALIAKQLTFTAPTATTLTTMESHANIQGSANPHFPLTMNNQNVPLSPNGYFSVDLTLSKGVNTFTFVNNGKKVVYTITYKVNVLKSIAPAEALTLSGGTKLVFGAVARKGATVTAKFAGKTLTLKPSALQAEEDGDNEDLSDYQNYTVETTLPDGVEETAQNLGAAAFTASLNGLKESKSSGTVTVKALPPAVPLPPEEIPVVVPDLKPIDPGNGKEVLGKGDVVIVQKDYIETFSGETTDDYSRPTNAYLPKGTTDVIVSEVYDSSSKNMYYRLGSGIRVYKKDVALYVKNGTVTTNTLTLGKQTVGRDYFSLTMKADWRIPYGVQLLPQSYSNASMKAVPNYSINKYGQTTAYVEITFAYTPQAPALPDVSKSPLFSRAEWCEGANHSGVLRLYLAKAGQFYGYSVVWDSAGNITFSFKHPAGIADNSAEQPLKGLHIVIDPGHGGRSSGTYGTIPGLYEKTVALDYSLLLRTKLQALGAVVSMTRTTDVLPDNPDMNTRTNFARNNGTDLLISMHMNGVNGATASGCSIHYFNEYSYAIARTVVDRMRVVEKTKNIGNRSEPCAWSPFFMARVHDTPSILIECGFMTNPNNMNWLVDAGYRDQLTAAIATGIVDYFKQLPSYKMTAPATTQPASSPALPTKKPEE